MDWRSIGSSFTPALEAKETQPSTSSRQDLLTASNDDAKPPKYDRWLYIVGISQDDQEVVLDKLEEAAKNDSNHRHTKGEIAIQDITERVQRYYKQINGVEGDSEVVKERIRSFKSLPLDSCVTPSLDAWLRYIKAKASELVAKIQNNQCNLPEWILPRLTESEERMVTTQNCELLHKMSSLFIRTKTLEWQGERGNAAVAYMFTIILFYKKLLVPEFDHVLDALKWIKTWSNDYIRINNLRHEIPTYVHRAVSTEPVYWRYMASTIMRAKLAHNRFIKIMTYFFNHLRGMLDTEETSRNSIEKSMIIMLTECLIPRLLSAGHFDLAVNIVRTWLAYNLFNDNSCSNFGHLSKHHLLYSLTLVQRGSCTNKEAFMDLCDTVDSIISQGSSGNAPSYCSVKAVDIDSLPVSAVKLGNGNREELLFRLLELFGSKSIDRVGSQTRWYNFVKSLIPDRRSSQPFLTLMLLHSIIAIHKTKIFLHLLMGVCNSKEVSKKILQLDVGDDTLWTSYAAIETDPSHVLMVNKEAIKVFPNHLPLLVTSFMYHLNHSPEYLGALISDMSTKLNETANEKQATHSDDGEIYQAVLDRVTPSRRCAAAIVWTMTEKHNLHESKCRAKWNELVAVLSETEAALLLKVVCKCVPVRTGQKLAEHIVKLYGNNEDIVGTFVEYAIARSNKSMIKQLLSKETTQSMLSMATKHLGCFVKYTDDTMFDCAPARLMLLCRVDEGGNALRSIMEDPMPFQIPNMRVVHYILEKIKTRYDPIHLVTKNCPFSKALWLKLTEHLPASSNIIEEEMTSCGINI